MKNRSAPKGEKQRDKKKGNGSSPASAGDWTVCCRNDKGVSGMNILNIEHVSKIYGEKTIFDDASFGIQEGEKIGIIGINGTGKTTLLRMVAGLEEPDEGQVIRQNGLRIAYLPQNPEFPEGATIQSYIEDAESENSWMVQSNLTRLGIFAYDTPIAHLSGGQKKKSCAGKDSGNPGGSPFAG